MSPDSNNQSPGNNPQNYPSNTAGQQSESPYANQAPLQTPAQQYNVPMQSPGNTGVPSTEDTTPGTSLGVVALILAIFIAPIGFILGVVSMAKGFNKSKNIKLGLLGGIAVSVSLISSLVITILIASIFEIREGFYSLQNNTQTLGGLEVTMQIPENFEVVNETSRTKNWGYIKSTADDGSPRVSSQLGIVIIKDRLTVEDVQTIGESAEYKNYIFSEAKKYYISGVQDICENIDMSDPTQVSGNYLISLEAEYTCQSRNTETGSTDTYKGKLLHNTADNYEYMVFAMAPEAIWNKSIENINKILQNVYAQKL